MESKRGVSSWVRLGSASVGFFLEGLYQGLEDVKEGKWEKGWKEKGRSFSLVRDANRAGSFLRLGVVDLEKKRYNICIPKGRRERGGWLAMVEALCKLDVSLNKKEQKQEERVLGRSFVEMVKGSWNKGSKLLRVEVKGEEISRNLSRLDHCLIGSFPSVVGGEDLERLGWLMASSWGLKGKLDWQVWEKDGSYWSLSLWKKLVGSSSLEKGRWEGFSWVWSIGVQGRGAWKKVS